MRLIRSFAALHRDVSLEDLVPELMSTVSDRLSARWYVGYELFETLPDHSTLTRIRDRFGLSVFRELFERVVELYIEAGLVWSKELYFDATKVDANASQDSIAPSAS